MAESKKVVIKINIDKKASDVSIKPPSTVTVWHKQRIASVLVLLVLLLVSCIYGLSGWNEPKQKESGQSVAVSMPPGEEDKARGAKTGAEDASLYQINHHADSTAGVVHDKTESAGSEKKREFAIIFDKGVIRASLNSALKDNEPYALVTSPIKLSKNQTIELFYFTELKAGKHKTFYHYWSKDGRLVYKKKLDVQRKQLKFNSAKILSNKDQGNWQIQLVDKTGKIFSEVNFVVDSE